MDVEAPPISQPVHRRVIDGLPMVLVGAWVLLYLPTFLDLAQRWTKWDQDLSHGLPVMALFVYLVIKSLPWPANPPGKAGFALWVAALGLCSGLWLMAHIIHLSTLEQLLLLPLLALVLGSLFGFRAVFQHRFLLFLPIFAIPIWGSFNGVLLNASSLVVGELVQLVEMPARIEGNSIFIPYGHILIADGCSGLRYFVIALFLGYLIAYLNQYREKGFAAMLLAAAALGLVANWVRIFVLILIGYRTEMQSSLMTDHEMFGWVVFGLLCLPALFLAPVVKDKPDVGEPAQLSWSSLPLPRVATAAVALALGPMISLAIDMEPQVQPWQAQLERDSSAPVRGLPMPVTAPEGGDRQLARLSPSVTVRIDQYQRIETEDKLVPYFGRLYGAEAWLREDRGKARLAGQSVNLAVFHRKNSDDYVAQLQWFEVGGRWADSKVMAKLLQIPAVATGQNHFAIVTLQSFCSGPRCDKAIADLQQAAEGLVQARARAQTRVR